MGNTQEPGPESSNIPQVSERSNHLKEYFLNQIFCQVIFQGHATVKGVIPASLQNLKKVCGGVFLGGAAGLTAQPISGV